MSTTKRQNLLARWALYCADTCDLLLANKGTITSVVAERFQKAKNAVNKLQQ